MINKKDRKEIVGISPSFGISYDRRNDNDRGRSVQGGKGAAGDR